MNKWVLIAIVLTLCSAYLTAYTFKAYTVATSHIMDWNEETWWRTTPSGSLFPWPKEPGMLEALSKLNEVDLFIYKYLIKSSALVILSALIWIFTSLCIFKAVKRLSYGILRPEDPS